MSIFLGGQLLAGVATNTIYNAHDLFDNKWTDHLLNDQSWLRADTFSWQDGTAYTNAYNHLVADYNKNPYKEQNIVLELNNGTLTLKAGSKLCIPNGFESDGATRKFNIITISSDVSTIATSATNGQVVLFYSSDENVLVLRYIENCFSGGSISLVPTYSLWYDTSNNRVKTTEDAGVTWDEENFSLPISVLTYTSSSISSIDKIFNGVNYFDGETIGSHTIYPYMCPDGHKICTPDQETTALNIYNESGVAWYYILDTTNQRFKLPRELPITDKSKGNGVSLGLTDGTTNYGFQAGTEGQNLYIAGQGMYGQSVGSGHDSSGVPSSAVHFGITTDQTKSGIISHRANENGQQYLYFYVGQFSQTATEQTAGLNSELFNSKMDRDMSNMNPSATAKETIVGWGTPDWSAGIDIAVPLQATPYICPSDGVYVANFIHNGANNTSTYLYVNGIKTANCLTNSSSYNLNKSSISVVLNKNDSIYFDYGYSGTNLNSSSFYPLKGVNNA